MTPCQIVGVHDDGAASLTAHAQELLRAADLVIGAPHQLRAVATLLLEQYRLVRRHFLPEVGDAVVTDMAGQFTVSV